MPETNGPPSRLSRARMIGAAIFVLLVVIAVWWVIDYRQKPPPPSGARIEAVNR
jgi:hypothetical protein